MTALEVATATGSSVPVALILISLLAFVALYVWTAIALSAVFRKSGAEGWKAWVPVLNLVILLQLGGLSGWLVLLALIPVLGAVALWVVQIIACYRINVAFDHGAGMTVLAAVLFPVWATVLGFGSARWVGADTAPVGVRRSSADTEARVAGYAPADAGPPPPLPSAPAAAPPAAASVAGWTPAPTPAPADLSQPSAPLASGAAGSGAAASAPATGPAPVPPPLPPTPARAAAAMPASSPMVSGAPDSGAPVSGAPDSGAPDSGTPDPGAPGPGAPPAEPQNPAPTRRSGAPSEPISFVPVAGGSSTPPAAQAPPAADEPPAAPAPAAGARANQGWGGFELGAVVELTSEVTAAVSGAPRPISAIPADDAPPPPPAVTRVPSARPSTPTEPWAPARSPLPEPDAFPEASGEVSAVAGAPDAGIPRSARTSVSAQHVLPEVPDDIEPTIIASRRKTHWSLVLPSGTPVQLLADVVLVGRRPSPSTAYPNAQLVEVHDGTVSKTHMRLERHGEEWSVTDMQSTNGTILIASDGSENEIPPGAAHRAPGRFLIGDAEVRLTADDASR